jgi:hypothetical protein
MRRLALLLALAASPVFAAPAPLPKKKPDGGTEKLADGVTHLLRVTDVAAERPGVQRQQGMVLLFQPVGGAPRKPQCKGVPDRPVSQ